MRNGIVKRFPFSVARRPQTINSRIGRGKKRKIVQGVRRKRLESFHVDKSRTTAPFASLSRNGCFSYFFSFVCACHANRLRLALIAIFHFMLALVVCCAFLSAKAPDSTPVSSIRTEATLRAVTYLLDAFQTSFSTSHFIQFLRHKTKALFFSFAAKCAAFSSRFISFKNI